MGHYYKITRTLVEEHEVYAKNKKEAIEQLEDACSVTIKSVIVKKMN